jgi:hypothetical protein
MDGPVSVVVVSRDERRVETWGRWLRSAGYLTITCPGPTAVDCPRLDGGRCSRRNLFDLGVVDVESGSGAETLSGWPERACLKVPDDGRTVFVDSLEQQPPFGDESPWIPGSPTRETMLAAVRRAGRIGHAGPRE